LANNKQNYLAGKVIEHVLRNIAYTSPVAVYVALLTAPASKGSNGTEVTNVNTAYVRKQVTFGAQSSGTCLNSADVIFDVATPNGYGSNVTDFAIYDSATYGAGNMLYFGTLAAPVTINAGDQFKFSTSALSIQEL
jgi:hypothetical protein